MSRALVVLKAATAQQAVPDRTTQVTFDELKRWVRTGSIIRHLLRYDEVRLRTHRLHTLHKPFASAVLARALSRRTCVLEDEQGAVLPVGRRTLMALGATYLRDLRGRKRLLAAIESELTTVANRTGPARRLDLRRRPVYLRTDLVFGLGSGGSVGHIAGVLNNLEQFTGSPVFITTDRIPTVRDDVETHVVLPDAGYRDFAELPSLAFNATVRREAARVLVGHDVAFIYQRYSLENFAGLALARELGVPFVLEYNGSETWINRNWGTPLVHEELATRIELTVLQGADLVVVVSDVMRDELVGRGIPADRILVNPNGVDPERYSPMVDGAAVRGRYGLDGSLVIGFIGTFGPWHGAEVLADAFGRLVARRADDRKSLRLLMIGDGPGIPETRRVVRSAGVEDLTVFTGPTPQGEGAAHLAAADILVSPHVPNPDGTPFFGSPTKLFEYMAMGKPIVASDLGQIGEVLEHDVTGWLVTPGDPDALASGIQLLMDDRPRRVRLGSAAREQAVARHTWREHTRRIVEALQARCA